VYLIGNPLIANRMFEHDPAAAQYVPLRVSLYEDYEGKAHFTYERPSRALEQFADEEIRAVAQTLDDKLSRLAAQLVEP
jgi:uncharacterized protein (DUF302 family)